MHCARTCAYACFGCVLAADTPRERGCAGVGPCAPADLYFYGASRSYTWSRGGARVRGGRRGRHGPATFAGLRSRTRRAWQRPPLTTVGVVRKPQARRQRRANGDGRTGPVQSLRRRRGGRRHSSRSGDGRGMSLRGRGGRSPDGAFGGRVRGRLHLSQREFTPTGPPSVARGPPMDRRGRRGRDDRRGLETPAAVVADGTVARERG